MLDLRVTPVSSRSEMKAFIDLPWAIYKGDPNFVPPLKKDLATLLDNTKHPFWKHGSRQLYLARRGTKPVGRIVAIIDDDFNRHYNLQAGAFGFFECEKDPGAAKALFNAAEEWLRRRKKNFIQGPFNPSINYEIGILVEGFDSPPTLGFTHNPSYYADLITAAGYQKEKDVVTHTYTEDMPVPSWFLDIGAKLFTKGEFTVRLSNLKQLESEIRLVNRIYNQCWAENWGAVPMTDEEIIFVAHEMKDFVDPDLLFFLCYRGEPIGVCLVLPDVNRLLMALNGRRRPSVIIKHLLTKSYITGLRGYIMGVKPEFHQTGAPLVAAYYLMTTFKKKTQYKYMETGWHLEDNRAIIDLHEDLGARQSRRFRIFGKKI